ncbi:MAG: RagB/SusD family nutrient uptake outer membrane protein [Candidatus Ordinivivax streblomastigis]|uniref:RagB/SusD family nutrient uptake outer membrane protein n=1 Tax=Candidatus Ordinivivax streblomastigis TaxID=2540710 RepID=A0A5M8NX85_9BACT|nr:MAG: RagB/SusD family nutrient uptake outer membrane protein [Candidatus Ordinivivax streblomastigis]
MKKYSVLKTVFGLIICGMLFACEDMLQEKSFDFIGEFEDSNAGADQAAIGAYSYLLDDMFRWDQFPKVLDMDCDYATGPDWSLSKIGAGNFQGDDGMDPMWTKNYVLIHRTNNAIENIEAMTNASDAHKRNTIGEMKFLQAYAYFLLVRAYGEIPIRYQSVSIDPDYNKPREPIAKVYAHIVDLLKYAEDNVYKNTDSRFQTGRASAGAAASLLAKAYATMASGAMSEGIVSVKGGEPFIGSGDDKAYTAPTQWTATINKVAGYDFDAQAYYDSARVKAKQIIDGEYGAYDLLPYDQLWSIASRHKVEHIFMIQPVSGSDLYGGGIARYYTGTTDGSDMIIEGLFHGCSNHWYRLFDNDPQDLRVEQGVMHRWINRDYHESWNGGAFYPDDEKWENVPSRGIWASKAKGYYIDELTGNQVTVAKAKIFDDGRDYVNNKSADCIAYLMKYYNATDRSQIKSDVPLPVLRFADVLLIYAEAANETEQNTEALSALNRVRERSKASHKDITSKESLRSAILEERAMELALESDRRWDLIRWGIYLEVMNKINGLDENGINKKRENKHLLYPIPSDVMLTNKAIAAQGNNPGW